MSSLIQGSDSGCFGCLEAEHTLDGHSQCSPTQAQREALRAGRGSPSYEGNGWIWNPAPISGSPVDLWELARWQLRAGPSEFTSYEVDVVEVDAQIVEVKGSAVSQDWEKSRSWRGDGATWRAACAEAASMPAFPGGVKTMCPSCGGTTKGCLTCGGPGWLPGPFEAAALLCKD